MMDRCPRCGLAFERGEGFWLGAMAVNIGLTEGIFAAFVALALVITWPNVPWVLITVAAGILNVVVPMVFYPSSKTIFLAFDMAMRQAEPIEAHELEENDPLSRPVPPEASSPARTRPET
jgi:hypothetical protein